MKIFPKLAWRLSPNKSNTDYSFSATRTEKDELVAAIINTSSPSAGFYFLLALATFIVTTGLIRGNLLLLIGGMLVAPLLSPILSISLSIAILNLKVLLRSIIIFISSALASLIIAMAIGLVAKFDIYEIELQGFMDTFNATSLLIPIAAGAAASFTWAKKNLSGSLPGVAITVTLLPPLANMGLALAVYSYPSFIAALNIYLVNVLGIIIGSLIILLMMGFNKSGKAVVKQVEIDEKTPALS